MIIAAIPVGQRPEPWLPAMLESLEDAVDLAVVNDNSGAPQGENRRHLTRSRLYRQQRMDIVTSTFVDFAQIRNVCYDRIRERYAASRPWVLRVDTDEVHGPALVELTRKVLPALRSDVSIATARYVLFIQSPRCWKAVQRDHWFAARWDDALYWQGALHEVVRGAAGSTVHLPYVYWAYGNVRDPSVIQAKWRQYQDLGDPNYPAESLDDCPGPFDAEAPHCVPFLGRHPEAVRVQANGLSTPAGRHFESLVRSTWLQQHHRRAACVWEGLRCAVHTAAHCATCAWPSVLSLAMRTPV